MGIVHRGGDAAATLAEKREVKTSHDPRGHPDSYKASREILSLQSLNIQARDTANWIYIRSPTTWHALMVDSRRKQLKKASKQTCIRNGIKHSCPDGCILLDPVRPFTLCSRARRGPIPRQCDDVVSRITHSDEWCIDCWEREEAMERLMKQNIGGEGRYSKYRAVSK